MICYFVEIAQEMPEQRTDPNAPLWEALVAVPDEAERSVKREQAMARHGNRQNRHRHRLRIVNDPDFKPHARRAWLVDFDGMRARYPETDFTFPDFITDDRCQVWFLRKPHLEV
jgi:hypothetical protein